MSFFLAVWCEALLHGALSMILTRTQPHVEPPILGIYTCVAGAALYLLLYVAPTRAQLI